MNRYPIGPCAVVLFRSKMIQSALEISPEILHQESAFHQHLSCVSFLCAFQPVCCFRVKASQEYFSGMAVWYDQYLHVGHKYFFFVL